MQTLKDLFNKKLKLLLSISLVLGFSLFFVSSASAGYNICECSLSSKDSVCDQAAANSICIEKSFIDNVINEKGVDFELRDGLGNNLNMVTVTDTRLEIRNTERLFFADSDSEINNPDLDIDINVAEGEEPREYSLVSFRNTDIGGCTNWQEEEVGDDSVKSCLPGSLVVGAKTLTVKAGLSILAPDRWFGVANKITLETTGTDDDLKRKILFGDIYVPEPPTGIDGGVDILAHDDGSIKGGDIFAQPGMYQTGNGGVVALSGKQVHVGNINIMGYPDSGELFLNAETAFLKDIAVHSIEGWKEENGIWDWSGKLTKPSDNHQLKIGGYGAEDAEDEDIESFTAENIYVTAADNIGDVNITATERIHIKKSLYAYSGCIPGTIEEIEDYPNKPTRKICQVGDSGNINLEVTDKGKDKGIWVEESIVNDALPTAHENARPDDDFEGGEGFVGEVSLKAGEAMVAVDSILSRGFHWNEAGVADREWSVYIEGRYVFLKSDGGGEHVNINTSSCDQAEGVSCGKIFPEEVDSWPVVDALDAPRSQFGGGNIYINLNRDNDVELEQGCSDGQAGGCLLFKGSILANGEHPFAPRGGNIKISGEQGAFRVETTYNPSGNTDQTDFKISAKGVSLDAGTDRYDVWYIRDGMSIDPDTGNYVAYNNNDFENYCNSGKEYINGADAGIDKTGSDTGHGDGLKGGNGGNVRVEAARIQLFSSSASNNKLRIDTNGGNGSRGGHGGISDYCDYYLSGDLDPTHVIPDPSQAGKGGDGGWGGNVTIQTIGVDADHPPHHCFDCYEISSYGGNGGDRGDIGVAEQWAFEGLNRRMGTCDLAGWGVLDNNVPEIKTPPQAGKGGYGGSVTLDPMPTDPDDPIEDAYVYVQGGDAGGYQTAVLPAYPYYCTDVQFNENDPDPANASTEGNEAHAKEYMEEYKGVYGCVQDVLKDEANCIQECREKYCDEDCHSPYDDCRGVCVDNKWRAKSQCEWVDKEGECSQPQNHEYTNEEYLHDKDTGVITPNRKGCNQCSGNFQYRDWESQEVKERCRPQIPQAACMKPATENNEDLIEEEDGGFTQDEVSSDGLYLLEPEQVGHDEILEAKEARPGGLASNADGQRGADGGAGGNIDIDTEWEGEKKIFKVHGGQGGSGTGGQHSFITQPGRGGDGGDGGWAGSVKVWQPDTFVNDSYLFGGDGGNEGWAGSTEGGRWDEDGWPPPGFVFPRANGYCADSYGDNPFFWDWDEAPPDERHTGCTDNYECGLDEYCDSSSGVCVERFACDTENELVSCRTKEPFGSWWSQDDYSVNVAWVRVNAASSDGTPGLNGSEGDLASIEVNQEGDCENNPPIDETVRWIMTETSCCNGEDDDGDGLTDCEDPDCEKKCYDDPGYLRKDREECRIPDDGEYEIWEKVCNVVICLDDYDNDKDGSIDIKDKSKCEIRVANALPEVKGAWWEQIDECDKGHPSVKLWWQYSDSDDDQQTKYEVEIKEGDNVIVNGVKDGSTNSVTYSDVGDEEDDHLKYNTQYSWQVRVFDGKDWSEWKEGEDFTLTEWPRPKFEYQVFKEQTEEGEWINPDPGSCLYEFPELCNTIQGTPDLKLDITANNTQSCNDCTYEWDFDGEGTDSQEETPEYTYTSSGNYVMRLTAKDGQGRSCYQEMGVDLGGSQETPKWWEIAPF